jgi:hypothetical protein
LEALEKDEADVEAQRKVLKQQERSFHKLRTSLTPSPNADRFCEKTNFSPVVLPRSELNLRTGSAFVETVNSTERVWVEEEEHTSAMVALVKNLSMHLSELRSSNVLNSVFHIWCELFHIHGCQYNASRTLCYADYY